MSKYQQELPNRPLQVYAEFIDLFQTKERKKNNNNLQTYLPLQKPGHPKPAGRIPAGRGSSESPPSPLGSMFSPPVFSSQKKSNKKKYQMLSRARSQHEAAAVRIYRIVRAPHCSGRRRRVKPLPSAARGQETSRRLSNFAYQVHSLTTRADVVGIFWGVRATPIPSHLGESLVHASKNLRHFYECVLSRRTTTCARFSPRARCAGTR